MNFSKILLAFFLVSSFRIDAVELRGFLSQDEISLFYKQGYLLKRQCLNFGEMQQLNDDITAVIDRAFEEIRQSSDLTYSEEEQAIYIDGSRVVCKKSSCESLSIARINGCGGMEPSLLGAMRSEKMVRTFFELLGTNDLEHLISQIHPKLPGDGIGFPRHRDIQFRKSFDPDWQDILGNGSYAICIIPIEQMTPENGGLWVDRNNYPEPQGAAEDLVWLYAEPGDLLFMHPHLFHGSSPNAAPTSRKTLLTGFCAFGANHKPYPGAHVNTRFMLTDDGTISMTSSPWSQGSSTGLDGH